jgi:glycosyltransferase involved in cell wall biosynthesis
MILESKLTSKNQSNRHKKRAIMSICSNNYFPYVRILFTSLKTYHPEASLFLCLADLENPEFPLEVEGVEIIEAKNLGIPHFNDFAFRYDIMEFNTALKPFMMQLLIEKYGFEQVVYLDPDIELFAPMKPIFDALDNGANFVLTPHITQPEEGKEYPNDIGVMKAGIYNLGFIAVSNSNDAINFLHWWGRRLRFQCINNQNEGIFVDQKFVDLLPAFHNNVKILRDTNLNVAYWNLQQRHLQQSDTGWLIDGQPLIFFHFSGINIKNNQRLSKHSSSFTSNLEPPLQALIDHYIAQLKKFSFQQKFQPKYAYGTFKNHVPIPDIVRQAYKQIDNLWFEDPFLSFPEYLNQFQREFLDPLTYPLTNLMYLFWQQREDLQKSFNIYEEQQRKNYSFWFIDNAEENQIDYYFIESILDIVAQNSLPNYICLNHDTQIYSETDLNVIGYLCAEMGVGHAGRMVAKSLETTGLKIKGFNVTTNVLARQKDTRLKHLLSSEINGKVHLYNVNADQLAIVRKEIDAISKPPLYRINMPFWELSKFPSVWRENYEGINEIWAASRFIQKTLQTAISIPVVWMPPAITIEKRPNLDRNFFNLPENIFLFHFNFDFSSYATRKNPMAVIDAYRLAFRYYQTEIPTALVIKTMGYDPEGKNLQKLRESINDESNDMIVINEQMTHNETLALMNCCDCYVSLHRSEGFGYTLAESMLLGKPVIATNYGGTKDFLNHTTGFPVDYQLKSLEKDEYPFAEGQKWANPDINHAAWLMKQVVKDQLYSKTIAKQGQEKILKDYSPQVVGKRFVDRLRQIGVV